MRFFTTLFLIGTIIMISSSCDQLLPEERTAVVSFWTDQQLEASTVHSVLINGVSVGELMQFLQEPDCASSGLVSVPIADEEDMHLKIETDTGGVYELGLINLFSPAQGIMVKPAETGGLFVQHDLDEVCTRVRLRW